MRELMELLGRISRKYDGKTNEISELLKSINQKLEKIIEQNNKE